MTSDGSQDASDGRRTSAWPEPSRRSRSRRKFPVSGRTHGRTKVAVALLPGLGQVSQGRLWAGILYLTVFGANAIVFLRPVAAYVLRSMDVSPRAFVAAGVTMGLIWLVARDAYVYMRLDRRQAQSDPVKC